MPSPYVSRNMDDKINPYERRGNSLKKEKESLRSYIDSPERRPASTSQDESQEDDMMMSLKETLKREIEREQKMMYKQKSS